MKYKVLFVVVILSIIGFMSCEIQDNPFIGTWETENNWIYTFTETTTIAETNDSRIYYTGTYTYDDNNITINVNIEESVYQSEIIIYPYTISGDILFLMNVPLTRKIN